MKSILATIAIALSLGQAAYAFTMPRDGWSCSIPGGPRGTFCVASDGLDGLDSSDELSQPDGWQLGAYKTPGVQGWDASRGFYSMDVRAPFTPGVRKTWEIYVWAVPGATAASRDINWVSASGFLSPGVSAQLECLQKPAGVTGGPDVGTIWTATGFWITLPFYSTDDGLTGYGFRLTVEMVPEPSALLALAGGLGVLGLPFIRRRR